MKLGVGCHVVLQEIHNEVSCFGGGGWGTWGTTSDKVAQFDLPSWWAEVHGVLGVLLRTRSHNLTCPLGAGRMWRMGYLGYYFGQGRTI